MIHPLDNPVYHALISGDAIFNIGKGSVKYFDEAVSPFAGFDLENENGFEELYEQLPVGRKILYACVTPIEQQIGWQQVAYIKGSQFVFEGKKFDTDDSSVIQSLRKDHVDEMVALAALTKPGPFNSRTIEFGSYHGVFENERLAAMTGQRLHVYNYTEVSAVCTHPDFLGKGYATVLLQHQLDIICNQGQVPFLHVRSDNDRAIGVYERLGFKLRGPMHFYFMKREV